MQNYFNHERTDKRFDAVKEELKECIKDGKDTCTEHRKKADEGF